MKLITFVQYSFQRYNLIVFFTFFLCGSNTFHKIGTYCVDVVITSLQAGPFAEEQRRVKPVRTDCKSVPMVYCSVPPRFPEPVSFYHLTVEGAL